MIDPPNQQSNKGGTGAHKDTDTPNRDRESNDVSLASRWEELSKDIAEFEKNVDVLLNKSDGGSGSASASAKESNRLAVELDKATERLDVILKRFENTFKLSEDGMIDGTSPQFSASQVTPLPVTGYYMPPFTHIFHFAAVQCLTDDPPWPYS